MKNPVGRSLGPGLLAVLALILAASPAPAQTYRPGYIVYLVRDQNGKFLDPKELDSIVTAKGEEMKRGETTVNHMDGSQNLHVPCLQSRIDQAGQAVTLGEMTLKYRGQTMRLIFGATAKEYRLFIDSVPFKAGTFAYRDQKWVAVPEKPH